MNLMANTPGPVLKRYFPILILVQHAKNFTKLALTHFETPVVQIKLKVCLRNKIFRPADVFESFRDGFPLGADFVDNDRFQIGFLRHLHYDFVLVFFLTFVFSHVFVVLRVYCGVVPEVEALTQMDGGANPGAEVFIIDFADFFSVFLF